MRRSIKLVTVAFAISVLVNILPMAVSASEAAGNDQAFRIPGWMLRHPWDFHFGPHPNFKGRMIYA